MYEDDDNNFINEDNFIYDEIVRRRQTACRTNWRFRATALTQRDTALAACIQASLSFCYSLMYLVIFQLYLLNQWIQLHNNEPNSPLFHRVELAAEVRKQLTIIFPTPSSRIYVKCEDHY